MNYLFGAHEFPRFVQGGDNFVVPSVCSEAVCAQPFAPGHGAEPRATWKRSGSQHSWLSLPRLPLSQSGRIFVLSDDSELPDFVKNALEASLPADLDDLYSDQQKCTLSVDSEKLARLRRDAEVVSATLRMA